MAYGTFKLITEVVTKFDIEVSEKPFIHEKNWIFPNTYIQSDRKP